MNKENSTEQLKFFLREMFQFNANDLDFGIYRIYNLKRKEIEHFIDGKEEHCLEPLINKTLELVSSMEKEVELTGLTAYLKKFNQESLVKEPLANFQKIEQLILNFGSNDAEKESLMAVLNSSTREFSISDELKDNIYNHILAYFEMYYSNGDFGYNNRSRNLYKVAYEADYDGRDTLFHWKHKGSLYIKTGSSFNAVRFRLKHFDKKIELRLESNEDSKNEEIARNNNKDTNLKHYRFRGVEEKDGVTRIVFNLSDASTAKADLFKAIFKEIFKNSTNLDNYLFIEGKSVFNDLTDDYDKVLDGSVKGIGALRVNRKTLLNKVNKNFERGSKIEIITEKGQERFSDETLETLYNIDQKINSFYIGNDSDYFIHENLQEFLTQEKERYIKNHIFSDLKSILDGKLDNTTIITAKAFDLVSTRIIEFLSTIEEFQKKLFTMKKKVVESEYCLTIDNIDAKYYKEILENKAQIAEWENLFCVKVKSFADLKTQPTLVLDTGFFRQKDGSNLFKDKILSEIEKLDERTNGLLINSENYQALNFLQERYRDRIQCIYIDPPYNRGNDGFVYKDNFRHSSWLSFMENRLLKSKTLLNSKGVIFTSIDDNEQSRITTLLNSIYGSDNFINQIIWQKKFSPQNDAKWFSDNHDFISCFAKSKDTWRPTLLLRTEAQNARYENPDNDPRGLWMSSGLDVRTYAAEYDFPIRTPSGRMVNPPQGRCWRCSKERFEELVRDSRIWFGPNGGNVPRIKRFLSEVKDGTTPLTIWTYDEVGHNQEATQEVKKLGIENFTSPKPVRLIKKVVHIGTVSDSVVLDFFAGSGTTAHAVISLNKDDNGNGKRKYVLVEMGSYFSTVTKPRIQKVIYSQKWKHGKPLDNDGSPRHIFKYLVLEQYEDVLDVIEQFKGEIPKNLPLKYLYKPELNKINSTLDLSKPFSSRIRYGQPNKEGFIDLVDTYNYLQAYEVKTIKTYDIGKKFYKVVETPDTLVIWRNIDLGEDDRKAVVEIAEKYPEALQIDINCDFNILATQKDRQLQTGKRLLTVNIIHAEIFNQ